MITGVLNILKLEYPLLLSEIFFRNLSQETETDVSVVLSFFKSMFVQQIV